MNGYCPIWLTVDLCLIRYKPVRSAGSWNSADTNTTHTRSKFETTSVIPSVANFSATASAGRKDPSRFSPSPDSLHRRILVGTGAVDAMEADGVVVDTVTGEAEAALRDRRRRRSTGANIGTQRLSLWASLNDAWLPLYSNYHVSGDIRMLTFCTSRFLDARYHPIFLHRVFSTYSPLQSKCAFDFSWIED